MVFLNRGGGGHLIMDGGAIDSNDSYSSYGGGVYADCSASGNGAGFLLDK
jgi:hypothetical protein